MRISARVSRMPCAQTPRYFRPGSSSVTSSSLEKNVCRTSSTCGGKTSTPRPYRLRTWSSAFRTVAVEATISGTTAALDAIRSAERDLRAVGSITGELRLADDFRWECVNHLMEYGPETLAVTVGA